MPLILAESFELQLMTRGYIYKLQVVLAIKAIDPAPQPKGGGMLLTRDTQHRI
jgi:hypothetical protein